LNAHFHFFGSLSCLAATQEKYIEHLGKKLQHKKGKGKAVKAKSATAAKAKARDDDDDDDDGNASD
jgi:hypothetical protein